MTMMNIIRMMTIMIMIIMMMIMMCSAGSRKWS